LEEWKYVEELYSIRPTWKYVETNYTTKRQVIDELVAFVEVTEYED
jgi:hypothetical protein